MFEGYSDMAIKKIILLENTSERNLNLLRKKCIDIYSNLKILICHK